MRTGRSGLPFTMIKVALLSLLSTSLLSADQILLVLTNHAELGDTGKRTGAYLGEAAHPYQAFTEAGHEVTLASPEGGVVPIDPKSLELDDAATKAFWETYGNSSQDKPAIEKTTSLGEVKSEDFDGIFFAGGHGTMWDFPDSEAVQTKIANIYEAGGVVGAVCHGPAALVNVKLEDGSYLVDGKTVSVFSDSEEKAVELENTVPFLLASTLEERGAKVVNADDFEEKAVRSDRLVTGQNPASAKRTAELFLETLVDAGKSE